MAAPTKIKRIEEFVFALEKTSRQVEYFQSHAPLLLLEKENYYKDRIIEILKGAYGAAEVVYGDELDNDKIQEIFSGGGLFSASRLLLIRQAEKIGKGEESKASQIMSGLISGGQGKDALLISAERKINSRMQKAISDKGNTVICWPLFDNQILPWLMAGARKIGFQITPKAAEVIKNKIGPDLNQLEFALHLVKDYLVQDKSGPILRAEESLIEKLFPFLDQNNLFEFLNEIFDGGFARSIRILHSLLDAGFMMPQIVNMVASEVSRLYLARSMVSGGLSMDNALERLDIKKIQSRKFIDRLKMFDLPFLKNLARRLAAIDALIKRSNWQESVRDLESLIVYVFEFRRKKVYY
jgi:DNA polymerase III delta subunit